MFHYFEVLCQMIIKVSHISSSIPESESELYQQNDKKDQNVQKHISKYMDAFTDSLLSEGVCEYTHAILTNNFRTLSYILS